MKGRGALVFCLLTACKSLDYATLASHYYNIGNDYYRSGNYQSAAKYYALAVEQNPDFRALYLHYGLALIELERFAEAETYLKKVHEFDPVNTEVLSALGYLSFQRENYEEAVSWYEMSAAVNPFSSDTFYNLAVVTQRKGQYQKSSETVEKLLGLAEPDSLPSDVKYLQALNYLYLGEERKAGELYREYFAKGKKKEAYDQIYDYYTNRREYSKFSELWGLLEEDNSLSPYALYLWAKVYFLGLENNLKGREQLKKAWDEGFKDEEELEKFFAELSVSERRVVKEILELQENPDVEN